MPWRSKPGLKTSTHTYSAVAIKEMDAVCSATVPTAELFGITDKTGTLEAGKLADLIAVTGDPLTDISALQEIDFVMKCGVVAKQEGQVTEPFIY